MSDLALTTSQPLDPSIPDKGKRRGRRLIAAARRGSEEALEDLSRELWPRAYSTALAMLRDPAAASDVAQESVLKALGGFEGFDSRRPLRPWICRIATNTALDWIKAEQRRGDVELTHEPAAPGGASELLELVEALSELDSEIRAMVVLRHLGGFDSNEIGAELGKPAATVRSSIHRALIRLRSEREPAAEEGDPR